MGGASQVETPPLEGASEGCVIVFPWQRHLYLEEGLCRVGGGGGGLLESWSMGGDSDAKWRRGRLRLGVGGGGGRRSKNLQSYPLMPALPTFTT